VKVIPATPNPTVVFDTATLEELLKTSVLPLAGAVPPIQFAPVCQLPDAAFVDQVKEEA